MIRWIFAGEAAFHKEDARGAMIAIAITLLALLRQSRGRWVDWWVGRGGEVVHDDIYIYIFFSMS